MATATVSINIRAITRQAVAEIDKVKARLHGLTTSQGWKNMVTGVGVGVGVSAYNMAIGAIKGMGDALVESVNKAADEQAGIERLNQSLRANVAGFDGSVAAIERQIDARQALAFSDGDLRDSLSILVGATHNVNQAFELQQTAMDLARFKGIDLATASEALIKVESGQYRMLKSLGIELADGATRTEALAAVQAVAAGQAKTYASTYQGTTEKLNIAIENLQEDIGETLLPALQEFVTVLNNDVMPALRGAVKFFKDNEWAISLLTESIKASLGPGFALGVQSAKIASAMEKQAEAADGAARSHEEMRGALLRGTYAAGTAASTLKITVIDKLGELSEASYGAGADAAQKLADGLTSIPETVGASVTKVRDIVKNGLTTEKLKTRLLGVLGSTDFIKGIQSADPILQSTMLATGQTVIAGLAALFGPAYAAGAETWLQWQSGWAHGSDIGNPQVLRSVSNFQAQVKAAFEQFKGKMPTFDDLLGVDKTGGGATTTADKVKTAFEKMKRAGTDYYEALHRKTLQSIDDARREMNARYDAQIKALNGQVSAAREALQAEREARQQASLQAAVANATDDQARADAQQALDDFLADQQLRALEKSVDTQISGIEAQRDAENAKLDAVKQAATERYDAEKQGFDALTTLTNTSLAAMEQRWAEYAASVLASLKSIGMAPAEPTVVEGKALGGAVRSGAPYLVGERGPELFVPGASGNIVPNGALGGGNISLNVSLSGAAVFDPYGTAAQQVATALLPGLRRALTASGMTLA